MPVAHKKSQSAEWFIGSGPGALRRFGAATTQIVAFVAAKWNLGWFLPKPRGLCLFRVARLLAVLLLGMLGALGEQGFQMFDQSDRISGGANRLQRPYRFQGRRQFFGRIRWSYQTARSKSFRDLPLVVVVMLAFFQASGDDNSATAF